MQIDINDAAERLDELVDRAMAGETVIFTRDGIPVARLVSAEATETSRTDADLPGNRQP